MHLPQKQLTIPVVTGLAALLAALALAVIAATPGYAMVDPGPPQTTQTGVDFRAPDRQAPAPEQQQTAFTGADLRSPDRQVPAPEPRHVAFSGSASTTDILGPEDGPVTSTPAKALPGPPTWPAYPVALHAPKTSVSPDPDGGLEIWSAAAGAGAMFTLGLAALMGYALTIRRRGTGGTSSTTVAAGH